MALNHLRKQVRKIDMEYPWRVPPNAGLTDLGLCALLCSVALIFALWCIKKLCSLVKKIIITKHHAFTQSDSIKCKEPIPQPSPRPSKSLQFLETVPSHPPRPSRSLQSLEGVPSHPVTIGIIWVKDIMEKSESSNREKAVVSPSKTCLK